MQRYMPAKWVLPALDNHNRAFFTSGKLMVQKCAACGTIQHPPEDVCWKCQGMELSFVEAKGTGTVLSYTITHHPPSPLLQETVPYNVVLVALDDHPHVRIIGNVVNAAPDKIKTGLPVRVSFAEVKDEETGDILKIPQWEA